MLSMEELRNVQLMVGTPMYGMKCHGPFLSSVLALKNLCNQLGINLIFSVISNESLLQRARNYIVDNFIRSGATHLIFIDADIQFRPEDVVELLRQDKDIIGTHYTSKNINWENIVRASVDKMHLVAGDLSYNVSNPDRVMETNVLPTGFMMVKRHVFLKIQVAYPEYFYRPDHSGMKSFNGTRYIQMFFNSSIDPETQMLMNEYEFFCNTWKKIGGKIYTCPWTTTTHIGIHKY